LDGAQDSKEKEKRCQKRGNNIEGMECTIIRKNKEIKKKSTKMLNKWGKIYKWRREK
jgi:hypothetical protein